MYRLFVLCFWVLFVHGVFFAYSKNSSKRLQAAGSPAMPAEVSIKPRDRALLIQSKMEAEIQKQKHQDKEWDDQTDVSRLTALFAQGDCSLCCCSIRTNLDRFRTRQDYSRLFRPIRLPLGRRTTMHLLATHEL